MKTILSIFFGVIAMTLAKGETPALEKRVVYYAGFLVERYFPLDEKTIEQMGAKGEISRTDFLASIIKESCDIGAYDKYDVRGNVIF